MIRKVMSFIVTDKFISALENFPERNAFFIADKSYTYDEFASRIAAIQEVLCRQVSIDEKYIGVVIHDDPDTYAAIYALWFSGKAFVPVNPFIPSYRNDKIVNSIPLSVLISSKPPDNKFLSDPGRFHLILTSDLEGTDKSIRSIQTDPAEDCYVLFTSGSTGEPKGVPISRKNLESFTRNFLNYNGYDFSEEDKFLQIYDLSFDASLPCYIIPLSVGASVYTVPQDQIKYLYAYKLMHEHKLTFVKMTPSTLAYLKPYFFSIKLDSVRYCLLGGEAFPAGLCEAWASCVPEATIQNVYGPTEATIICSIYDRKNSGNPLKASDGIVSIGKVIGENISIITDENSKIVPRGRKGELCIAGPQVTKGYWKDTGRTSEVFFEKDHHGKKMIFYKTGDLVFEDKEGYLMFCGRMDHQVQINGHRVEPGEIEKYARDFLDSSNVAAIAKENSKGTMEFFLFIENNPDRKKELSGFLEQKLPSYMIPKNIINLNVFPKTTGGKIDRTELLKRL